MCCVAPSLRVVQRLRSGGDGLDARGPHGPLAFERRDT